jgi:PBSX family phage terminase large subunit
MDSLNLCYDPYFHEARQLMARQTFNHAKASLWIQTLMPMIDKYYRGLFEINKSDYIITGKKTGSSIWLGGLEDKERTEKIFGQEYCRAFLNEASQMSMTTKDKVASLLAQNISGFTNQLIMDTNPRSPAHWLYKEWYVRKLRKDQIKLTWTPYDNIINLPDGYIDRLKNLSKTDRIRYLDSRWANIEGAVYENIHDTHKIRASKNWADYDYITGGIDWGYNAHVSIWGIKENMAICLYEIVTIGGRTKQIIDGLNKIPWLKEKVTFYCDHENDRIEELCEAGYDAKKASKEVGAGDSTVNSKDLYFDETCEETFQSMLNLMKMQDNEGNYMDKHLKVNDHGADTARYAVHSARMEHSGGQEKHFLKKNIL